MRKRDEHNIDWYVPRIEFMSQFLLPERFDNMRRVVEQRMRYMTICMENTFHPQNASALVRNCEAFGVQDIHAVEMFCGFKPNTNIVRGTDKWVDIYRYESTSEAVEKLKGEGYRLVVTSPHKGGFTPETFDIDKGKFCVVFGSEKHGASEEIMASADEFMIIPMCGFVESLNVSASAAILMHVLTSRVRRSAVNWQLSEKEKFQLLFDWMMESVRDSWNILDKHFEK